MIPPKSITTRFPFHNGSAWKDLRYHPSHIGLKPRAPPPAFVQGCSNWKSCGRSRIRQEESSNAGAAKLVPLFSSVTNWNFQSKLKSVFCCDTKPSKGVFFMRAFSCTFWYCAMVTLLGIITKSEVMRRLFIRRIIY